MPDVVFNAAKGKVRYYAELGAATDALIAVLLKGSGLQADATLVDHSDLAALLAATNDEADFTNYARQTITSATITQDNTNDRVDIDVADMTWVDAGNAATAAGSGAGNNVLGKLLFCYDAATGSGTDADIVPLTAHDLVASTDGNDLVAQIPSTGFFRAQ